MVQTSCEKETCGNHFRVRNHQLFTRRHELQERISILRATVDAGDADIIVEDTLRRMEREFDDLTYEIMTTNYGLVRRCVAMFTSKSQEHAEDFESAGKVGLLWAISSYDLARGPFSSWAYKPIQREVLRAVRDADHPNLNPSDFDKRPVILAAERAYLEESGPDATVDYAAIAERAEVTEAQVRRVLDAPRLDSLQSPITGSNDEPVAWEDRLPDPSPSVEDEVVQRSLIKFINEYGMARLDDRERYVLTRRFGLDGETEQSLRVIGEHLGLSREGARQIQQKALAKLNAPITDTT